MPVQILCPRFQLPPGLQSHRVPRPGTGHASLGGLHLEPTQGAPPPPPPAQDAREDELAGVGGRSGGTRSGARGPPGGAIGARTAHLAPGASSERSQAARELFSSRSRSPSPPARRPPARPFALPVRRGSHFPAAPADTRQARPGARPGPAPRAAGSPRPRAPPPPRLGSESRVGEQSGCEGERRAEQAALPAARAPARGGGAAAHPPSCLAAGRPGRSALTPMAARACGPRSRSARARAPE